MNVSKMEKAHAIRNELFAVQQAIISSPRGSKTRATLESASDRIERRLMVDSNDTFTATDWH